MRGQMCLTQQQLADKLDLHILTIGRYENKSTPQPPYHIILACKYLLEHDND